MAIEALVLFGIIFIVGGLYNLYGRDSLWQSQVHFNEMNGIPESQRTDTWENQRTGIGWLGVAMGGLFLGLVALHLFSSGATAQRPLGEYRCLIGTKITSGEFVVKIDADGQGSYNGQPLTWTYDGKSSVDFAGDVSVASGRFLGSDFFNEFTVVDKQGVSHACIKRSR